MCGVWAFLTRHLKFTKEQVEAAKRLSALQRHRGPDHCGVYVTPHNETKKEEKFSAILVHERLAIIDVKGAQQPLKIWGEKNREESEEPEIAMIINGEIYDYEEHRQRLQKEGCVFKTDGDCEVLLHLYKKHGPSFLQEARVHGMFAFILFDLRDGGSFLVGRDHVGIIPLFWALNEQTGDCFVSSEIKSLIGEKAIACAQSEGNNPLLLPLPMVQGSPNRDVMIKHFPIGSVYSSRLNTVIPFWNPPPRDMMSLPINQSPASTTCTSSVGEDKKHLFDPKELRDALFRAVESHMISDVPYGVVLSGGLDSSLIAAIAVKILNKKIEEAKRLSAETSTQQQQRQDDDSKEEKPLIHHWEPQGKLITFTIGTPTSQDAKFAQAAAEYLDTEHYRFEVTPEEALEAIKHVVWHLETFDAALVRPGTMQYLLAKRIRELGLKVCLSGEGADEVFGGYWHFKNIPSVANLHTETVNILCELHHNDCMRANKAMMAHSVELRVPLLDPDFLDIAMLNIPTVTKMPKDVHHAKEKYASCEDRQPIEKWALRMTAMCDDPPLLPADVLWREKEGFSSGVGDGYGNALDKFYSEQITDEALAAAEKRFPYITPHTKEEYFLRSTFVEMFGGNNDDAAAKVVPKLWRDERFGMNKGEEWLCDANSRKRLGAK